MKLLFQAALLAFMVLAAPAVSSACSMGYGTQHNFDHDGTPNCASCTCAHHKAETPGEVHRHGPNDEPHSHADPSKDIERVLETNAMKLAACRTYKVICGRICTPRRVKNGGVWITVQDCKPKYCDHTTCN